MPLFICPQRLQLTCTGRVQVFYSRCPSFLCLPLSSSSIPLFSAAPLGCSNTLFQVYLNICSLIHFWKLIIQSRLMIQMQVLEYILLLYISWQKINFYLTWSFNHFINVFLMSLKWTLCLLYSRIYCLPLQFLILIYITNK